MRLFGEATKRETTAAAFHDKFSLCPGWWDVCDPARVADQRYLDHTASGTPRCASPTNLRNIEGMAKHSTDILTWARRGAEARWNELQAETASLLKAFPDLASISQTAKRTVARSARGLADSLEPARKRKRSKMSAAQRRAVSARMKKYWASRRAAKK